MLLTVSVYSSVRPFLRETLGDEFCMQSCEVKIHIADKKRRNTHKNEVIKTWVTVSALKPPINTNLLLHLL